MFVRSFPSLIFATALLGAGLQSLVAQNAVDDLEMVRDVLKADRKVVVAEAMQLSETESTAFWPLYRDYRTDMEKLGDGIVELILEFSDVYPNVPEDRAEQMLKEYLTLETESVSLRTKHLEKFATVLPKSKVLRLAQIENRLDLALRLQLASVIPLVPATVQKP